MARTFAMQQVEEGKLGSDPIKLDKVFSEKNLTAVLDARGANPDIMQPLAETLSALCFAKLTRQLKDAAAPVRHPSKFEVVVASLRDSEMWFAVYAHGARPRYDISRSNAKRATVGNYVVCFDSHMPQGEVYYVDKAEHVTIIQEEPIDADGTTFYWPARIEIKQGSVTKTTL